MEAFWWQSIKHFYFVIHDASKQAEAFVKNIRVGSKGLPDTNVLAY
jgi:hypothetical protein